MKDSGMCLRTDATSIQGLGTGTHIEINIKRIRELMRFWGSFKNSLSATTQKYAAAVERV